MQLDRENKKWQGKTANLRKNIKKLITTEQFCHKKWKREVKSRQDKILLQ